MENFSLRHAALWYAVFLFCTVCHEAAHAWAGCRLGDATAASWRTLDPRPHLARSPFGMAVVPWITYFLTDCGWMLGYASVPCDPSWTRANPRKAAWAALAGPGANLALLLVFAALRHGFAAAAPGLDVSPEFRENFIAALEIPVLLNFLYAAFNLLPLPPLDGASLPLLFLPPSLAGRWLELIHDPSFAFMGLFAAWMLFERLFPAVLAPVLGRLL